MKKLLLLGLLLSLSTGCGRGWMPWFRGASCGNGGCIGAAPALPQGCNTCAGGNSAGYGGYSEGAVSSGEIVSDYSYGGNSYIPGESYPTIGNGMAPIAQPAPAS
jgi:hypothetical protein